MVYCGVRLGSFIVFWSFWYVFSIDELDRFNFLCIKFSRIIFVCILLVVILEDVCGVLVI